MIWVGKKFLVPGLKEELEQMLHDKFLESERELERRHAENRRELERLAETLAEGTEEDKKIRDQITVITADVAYLRGKSSGTFKKPPSE
jgi:hypothetical protein